MALQATSRALGICCTISLCLALVGLAPAPPDTAGQQTLREDHRRFYRAGATLDVSDVLGLDDIQGRLVKTVTIQYNMARSELEVDWLLGDEVLVHAKLDRGIGKEVSCTFDRPLPASVQARFTGTGGQVQIRSVSAVTVPLEGQARIVAGPAEQEQRDVRQIKDQRKTVKEQEPAKIDEGQLTGGGLVAIVGDLVIHPLPLMPGRPSTATLNLSQPAPEGGWHLSVECLRHDGTAASHLLKEARLTVDIEAGEEAATFELNPRSGIPGPEEIEVSVRLGGGTVASVPVMVRNPPDVDSVRIEPETFRPGTSAIGIVELEEPALPGGTPVTLEVSGNKAEGVQVPAEIMVPEGQREVEFEIVAAPATEDSPLDGRNRSRFAIQAGTGSRYGTAAQYGWVQQPEIESLSIAPREARAGEAVTVTVTLEEPASPGGTVLALQGEGSEEEAAQLPERLWIAEGETMAAVPIAVGPTSGGSLQVGARSAIVWHRRTVTFTYGAAIAPLRFGPHAVRPGTTTPFVVTLAEAAMSGGATISLSLEGDNPEYFDVPTEILIPEGETTGAFEITVPPQEGGPDERAYKANQDQRGVEIVASTPVVANGRETVSTYRQPVVIAQAEVESLAFTRQPIRAGQTVTVTASLEEPASPGGTVVWISKGGEAADFADVPEEIRIPEGAISAEFEVHVDATARDEPGGGDFFLVLEASSATYTRTANVGVDPPTWLESIEVSPDPIWVGGDFTITVNMREPVPWDDFQITVQATEDGYDPDRPVRNPTFNCDVGPNPLTIPKGRSQVVVEYRIRKECDYEGRVNFWLRFPRWDYFRAGAGAELYRPPEIEDFGTSTTTVRPGRRLVLNLVLTDPAPEGGMTVRLSAPSARGLTVPREVTIAGSSINTLVEIEIAPDADGDYVIYADLMVGGEIWSQKSFRFRVTLQ